MRNTFHADSSIVLQAAVLHLLAGSVFSEIIPTFARNAPEIIVSLALFDGALVVIKNEGLVTLRAGVVGLLHFASQEIVVLAFVKDKGVFNVALFAGIVAVVFFAVFDSGRACSLSFDETIRTVRACAIR
jgi:hypothetical protein